MKKPYIQKFKVEMFYLKAINGIQFPKKQWILVLNNLSNKLYIVKMCLIIDEDERWSANKLLTHPWI
jgi:hypothetical protein